jgi:hypothetical protein
VDAGQKDNLFHVGYGWWGGLGVRSTGQLISNLDFFFLDYNINVFSWIALLRRSTVRQDLVMTRARAIAYRFGLGTWVWWMVFYIRQNSNHVRMVILPTGRLSTMLSASFPLGWNQEDAMSYFDVVCLKNITLSLIVYYKASFSGVSSGFYGH